MQVLVWSFLMVTIERRQMFMPLAETQRPQSFLVVIFLCGLCDSARGLFACFLQFACEVNFFATVTA